MSSLNNTKKPLDNFEWEDLNRLKDHISEDFTTINVVELEKFTELFVRSLQDKGNYPYNIKNTPTNY